VADDLFWLGRTASVRLAHAVLRSALQRCRRIMRRRTAGCGRTCLKALLLRDEEAGAALAGESNRAAIEQMVRR